MDKNEYGIKLDLDLGNFERSVKKAQDSLAGLEKETKRKVKVTGIEGLSDIEVKTNAKDIEKEFENLKSAKDRIASGEIKITGVGGLSEEEMRKSEAEYEKMRQKMSGPVDASFMGYDKNLMAEMQAEFDKIDAGKMKDQMKEIKQETDKAKEKVKELKVQVKSAASASIKLDKLKGLGKNIGKAFGNGVKSVKRFALSLIGVQSAYRVVTKAMHSYMSYDSELQKSMQQTWAGLGSFLAPILERLVSIFQKLLAYINAVVKAMTGIDFVARANAKSLQSQAKAASKTTASFDEINNLNQQQDANQINIPEIPTESISKIEQAIARIKALIGTIFEPMQLAWENKGPSLMDSIKTSFSSLSGLGEAIFGSMLEVWTNGTGQQTIELMLQGWTSVFDVINNVAGAITKAWNNASQGTTILQSLHDSFNSILELANSIWDSIAQWTISPEFQQAIDTVVRIFADISKIVKDILNWFVEQYNAHLKPVVDELLLLIADIINLIGAIWNLVKPVVNWIVELLKNVLSVAIKGVAQNISNIITTLRNVVNFLTNVFKGNWEAVFEAIKNVGRATLNAIIGFFNAWINGLNNLLKPVRSLITAIAQAFGQKVTINQVKIPNIPYLSVGTDLVKEDGIAYLHAGEKVVPADVVAGGYTRENNEETNELLRILIDTIESKDYKPYISVEDIGKASSKYKANQVRVMGGSY